MKHLNQYINIRKRKSSLAPQNTKELIKIVLDEMKRFGNDTDLNHIDVSGVKTFYSVFNTFFNHEFINFNCDISKWDVSNVISMEYAFNGCENFNGDLSEWDVSNVISFCGMFNHCTIFNCDISKWDTHKAVDMNTMFQLAKEFNQPIGTWNTDNVINVDHMFWNAKKLDQDFSSWSFPLIKAKGSYGVFLGTSMKKEHMPKNNWIDCTISI